MLPQKSQPSAKLRRGEISTEDGDRSGRPKEMLTEEYIKKKIRKMILNERKLKLNEAF